MDGWMDGWTGAHMYMHIYIYIYVCVYTYVHIYIRTYMHACMYASIHTYVYIHVYIYIYININTYIYIYTHTYLHIHICIHTHIYIYVHLLLHEWEGERHVCGHTTCVTRTTRTLQQSQSHELRQASRRPDRDTSQPGPVKSCPFQTGSVFQRAVGLRALRSNIGRVAYWVGFWAAHYAMRDPYQVLYHITNAWSL